jgi:hypothetical protein
MEFIRSNTLNAFPHSIWLFALHVLMPINVTDFHNNISLLVHRTSMFGPGRGRSVSLVDIPSSSSVSEIENGDHTTAFRRTHSSRCVGSPIAGAPSPAPDIAYGLGLLASDSPIGDHGEVDEQLLEYDSDESAAQQHPVAQIQSDNASMDTESQQQTNTKAAADSNANVILDDMYHQCRASRISVHRDNLVSICPDGTFGKISSHKLSPWAASRITTL